METGVQMKYRMARDLYNQLRERAQDEPRKDPLLGAVRLLLMEFMECNYAEGYVPAPDPADFGDIVCEGAKPPPLPKSTFDDIPLQPMGKALPSDEDVDDLLPHQRAPCLICEETFPADDLMGGYCAGCLA